MKKIKQNKKNIPLYFLDLLIGNSEAQLDIALDFGLGGSGFNS